ncbi:MAG: M28 family metallopeptidase, partial [Tepidiformaceae bacterium]
AMGEDIRGHPGWKLRVNFDITIESRIIHVVTGDIKGTLDPERFVMMGAHHDNVYVNEGAVDDAVGTATILELAYQLARTAPKYTIKMATFGGEEQGLLGSLNWRDAHMEEVNNSMIAMIQFDMNHVDLERCTLMDFLTNNNETVGLIHRAHDKVLSEHPSFETDFDPLIGYADTSMIGSDMASFADVGKTAMFASGCGSWEYHTHLDSIDRVKPASLAYSGQVFASVALSLANG